MCQEKQIGLIKKRFNSKLGKNGNPDIERSREETLWPIKSDSLERMEGHS